MLSGEQNARNYVLLTSIYSSDKRQVLLFKGTHVHFFSSLLKSNQCAGVTVNWIDVAGTAV